MNRLFCLLLGGALTVGCGSALPESLIDDPAYRAPSAADYPDDAAVVLLQREVLDQSIHPTELVQSVHLIVAILRDEGLDHFGSFFFRLGDEEELVDFEARVRTADGKDHEIDETALVRQVIERLSRSDDPDEEAFEWSIETLQATMPGVAVGSVVEMRYVIRSKYINGIHIRVPESGVPIRRFVRDVRLDPRIRFDLEVMNSDVPFEIDRTASGTRIRWVLTDIPAARDEPFQAAWHARIPWLLYRAKQVVTHPLGIRKVDVMRTWSDVDARLYETLYVEDESEHIFRDLAGPPPTPSCEDARCIVDALWAHVHRTVTVTHVSRGRSVGPLAPVIATGRANHAQVAVWLWYLLREAGVEASLAAVQRLGSVSRGLDRPMPGVFTHSVVYLPRQPGLDEAIWLDPSCPVCEPGQLPPSSRHRPARVIVGVDRSPVGVVTVRHEMHVTRGRRLPSGERRVVWSMQPGDDPAQWVWSRTYETVGQAAIAKSRSWSAIDDRAWRRHAKQLVADRLPTGTLTRMEPGRCSSDGLRCAWSMRGTMAAPKRTSDGRLIVPLDVFDRHRENHLFDRERQGPIWLRGGTRTVDRLIVEVPDGYRLEALPQPRRASSVGFDFQLVSRTEEGGRVVVERRLARRIGLWPRTLYDALRAPVRAFVAARGEVIMLRSEARAEPTANQTMGGER